VTLKLANSITLPPDFDKLFKTNNTVVYETFKFKIGQQELKWRPLEYTIREKVVRAQNSL
jgi:hypothetical protein